MEVHRDLGSFITVILDLLVFYCKYLETFQIVLILK